mmetsp:Transcript_9946/g.17076  ORF Transcript_9946/g.17076 Transcript_9946/m.17076 type:complete len:292 (+) Transcript_9946:120-995(+)|eukprot:CAMPEP_0198208604 /NCGR_PEP_ID=MMETSP1445-20131203/11946_1 /TAXON_ID=36898 /ORGANISM="Pyramimonas sp., Strain CCMP2087" /LENGTH=291 /DNA_ID=CAMNT_0043882057 /DNA_START=30 /DNA_END=905 /DNA_ORIENTATION=+
MSNFRCEALVDAECAVSEASHGSKEAKKPRPRGLGEVARAVQRCQANSAESATESSGAGPPLEEDQLQRGLRLAAVHHFRARMHFQMAQQYREVVWDGMKMPRKFFIKWRGLGPTHGREDLSAFRELFLRSSLACASRAVSLSQRSVECAFLKGRILWALATNHEQGKVTRQTETAKYVKATMEDCQRILAAEPLDPTMEATFLYGVEKTDEPTLQAVAGRWATVRTLLSEAEKLAECCLSETGPAPAGAESSTVSAYFPEPTTRTKEDASQLEGQSWSMWESQWGGLSIA